MLKPRVLHGRRKKNGGTAPQARGDVGFAEEMHITLR